MLKGSGNMDTNDVLIIMFTLICSLLLNVAMATCSQQVSGNFISLPSGSSQGERVGCSLALGPPFTVRGEGEDKPVVTVEEEEVLGLSVVVYWCTVPSVSWTTAVWVSGLV